LTALYRRLWVISGLPRSRRSRSDQHREQQRCNCDAAGADPEPA
jgi:hypothetical protein